MLRGCVLVFTSMSSIDRFGWCFLLSLTGSSLLVRFFGRSLRFCLSQLSVRSLVVSLCYHVASGDFLFWAEQTWRSRLFSPYNNVFSGRIPRENDVTISWRVSPWQRYQLNREQELLSVSSNGSSSYTFTTSVTERVNQVSYSCIPFNVYGHGSTTSRILTVICKC